MLYRVDEFWEPKLDGLETIVVKRQIPVIHILLSIDIVQDTEQNGFVILNKFFFFILENRTCPFILFPIFYVIDTKHYRVRNFGKQNKVPKVPSIINLTKQGNHLNRRKHMSNKRLF